MMGIREIKQRQAKIVFEEKKILILLPAAKQNKTETYTLHCLFYITLISPFFVFSNSLKLIY